MEDKKPFVTDFLDKNSPVDEIEVKLDSEVVDFSVSYDKKKGSKASLTFDLNKKDSTDKDLEKYKLNLELEKEKLKLEAEKMRLAMYANSQPRTIEPPKETRVNLYEDEQDEEEVEEVIEADENMMGAKAFDD